MGRIIISGLKLFAYHGVNPEEKENGQFFVVDLTAEMNMDKPCLTDNLNDTVSYAAVIKTVRRVMCAGSDDLLERAAYRVAEAVLLEHEKLQSVEVTLKKPDAPISAEFDYVAVNINVSRQDVFGDEADDEETFVSESDDDTLLSKSAVDNMPVYQTGIRFMSEDIFTNNGEGTD